VTLCDVRDGPAINLKIESEVPSKVRCSIHGEMTGWKVVISPEVPRRGTALRNSADADCARKNENQKNDAGEAVSCFHSTHYTCELRFDQHNEPAISEAFSAITNRFSRDARGPVLALPKIGNSFVKIHRRKADQHPAVIYLFSLGFNA
jgi:hypothetical protein